MRLENICSQILIQPNGTSKGSVRTPALSFTLTAAAIAAASAASAANNGHVFCTSLSGSVIPTLVESHLYSSNHVLLVATAELREVNEEVALAIVPLNEAETLFFDKLLERACERHCGISGAQLCYK